MLQVVRQTSQETLYFRLRAIFGVAEEARQEAVFSVANEACAYLLAYALEEDSQGDVVRIDIATTDEYGGARGETKHDLVILTQRATGRKTRIPLRLLTLDALGQCYRRVGGDFERRPHPQRRGVAIRASEETARQLQDKFTNLVGGEGIQKARQVLNS